MPETSDEHKLIKDLIKGDAFAFDEIFRRYNKRVYTFSLKNLKNKENAEGVVQEVFINLWEERSKLKDIKNLNAWIFTICFNIIRNRFRQLASDRLHLKKFANTSLSDDNTTATEIEYNDLLEKAEDIIEQLPTRQKVVFNLSKKEGLSNTEISKKLNISKKTVENHLTKAKAFIRKAMVDERLILPLIFLAIS